MSRTTWKLALIGLLAIGLGTGTALAGGKGKGKGGGGTASSKGKSGGSGAGSGSASGGDEGEIEMGGDEGSSGGGSASGSAKGSGSGSSVEGGEIEMGGDEGSAPKEGDLNADLNAAGSGDDTTNAVNANAAVPKLADYRVSWRDIVTVIRKPFLKLNRTEFRPMLGTTMNDNIIRHVSAGGEIAYYLTDVLAIGVEGQYYQHQFEEPFDLVARQARRLPTVNQYDWSAALDFHYVPVYGKFAVVDKHIVTWEVAFTAGIGAIQTEVIPRDKRFPGFSNINISPNIGADMRFFLAKWLTINAGIRDYIFDDKFEPAMRDSMTNATADQAAANADPHLINNIMFQLSVSFWFPTSFEYHTFR